MEDGGFRSRLGTALSKSGVYQLMGGDFGVRKKKRKASTARRAPAVKVAPTARRAPAKADARIRLIRTICEQEQMDLAERLAAVLLLTEK